MEKVKLPREVAEAIERTKSKKPTWNSHDLCYIVLNPSGFCQYENDADISLIHNWSNTNELKFAKALLLGYEVEETPEDKVREYFLKLVDAGKLNEANAIHFTLDWLGIKISGVNAE